MSIYKKLPEILKSKAYHTLEPLELLMNDKVQYIKFCFSKDLTDNQFKQITKDQELIKAISAHVTTLNNQIDYLVNEVEIAKLESCKAYKNMVEAREENQQLLLMVAKKELKEFSF